LAGYLPPYPRAELRNGAQGRRFGPGTRLQALPISKEAAVLGTLTLSYGEGWPFSGKPSPQAKQTKNSALGRRDKKQRRLG